MDLSQLRGHILKSYFNYYNGGFICLLLIFLFPFFETDESGIVQI